MKMPRPEITQVILERLDDAIERDEKPRQYIGASVIGNECTTFMELVLRGFPEPPIEKRTLRIFRDGHTIEDIIMRDLQALAFEMAWSLTVKVKGKQLGADAMGGFVSCHIDGKITDKAAAGTWIVEAKSMSKKYFNDCVKRGVKESHRKYYNQAQLSMGLMKIDLTMFVIYNKDDSQYEIQWIGFDEFYFHGLMGKAEIAIDGLGQRITDDKTSFSCRFCRKKDGCWGDVPIPINCLTCKHSYSSKSNGMWFCEVGGRCFGTVCDDYDQYKPRAK